MRKLPMHYIQPILFDVSARPDPDRLVATKITLGMGHFNRYKITIYRSSAPTPFPGGLDFQIYREVKNLPGRRPKRIWRPIGPHQVSGVTAKVFRRLAVMMADYLAQAHLGIDDMDGVPVPWEYAMVCQKIRFYGGLVDWQQKLSKTISDLHKLCPQITFGGNPMHLISLGNVLEISGFSLPEIQYLLCVYIADYGLLLKSSLYARYLQIAQPPRYRILEIIQNSLSQNHEWVSSDAIATDIVSAVPADLVNHLIRQDGTLRWSPLDFASSVEQDVEWELAHRRPIPIDLLAQYPALFVKYGLE